MTQAAAKDIARSAAPAGTGGWRHFGVGVGILLAAAVGFQVAVRLLRIHLVKAAVPHPPGTVVDDHWLASFPKRLGPYVLAPEVEGPEPKDGEADGLHKMSEELLRELDTTKHRLNWYYAAYFRDTRVPEKRGANHGRYFVLVVTYYTGLVDPVPHVPDVCLVAGGRTPLSKESLPLELPDLKERPAWQKVKVRRIAYSLGKRAGRADKSAQYYIFSMNGLPTDSRARVRWGLTLPWKKYCYFAKIQVEPLRPEPTMEATDQACRDFLKYAIPEVLRFLPTAEDVRKLEQGVDAEKPETKAGKGDGEEKKTQ